MEKIRSNDGTWIASERSGGGPQHLPTFAV
jgi:hypothetical protein